MRKEQEKISSEKLRLDTTVYETNIHYPTDSSLLWDSFRALARLLQQIQQELPQLSLKHRFHINKVKKLAYFITRNGGSNNKSKKRTVKSTYRKLIEHVNWIAEVAREALAILHRAGYEGSISVLERVFNLGRCLFKGFKNYAASIGCRVFCHNLVLLTRL
jgi:hypothetical protein